MPFSRHVDTLISTCPEPRISLLPTLSTSGALSLRPVAWTERPPAIVGQNRAPRCSRGVRRYPAAWLGAVAAVAVLASPLFGLGKSAVSVRGEVVSGAPEIKRTDTGELKRWHEAEITVHVDSSVDAAGPGARDAVIAALGAWQGSGSHMPRLTVSHATDTPASATRDGRNTVLLAPIDIPGHQNDLAITVSHSDSVTGEIIEADIIINARHAFRVLDDDAGTADQLSGAAVEVRGDDSGDDDDQRDHLGGGDRQVDEGAEVSEIASCGGVRHDDASCHHAYDLQSVVTHEFGHFFGLGEDRDDPFATMFFCTSTCETHKRSLSDSDTEAMGEVYAEGADGGPEVQCSVGGAGIPSGRCPLPWVGGALLGLAALLRRRDCRSR